jgi:hypothetical protein
MSDRPPQSARVGLLLVLAVLALVAGIAAAVIVIELVRTALA